jgi:hypothetical protein
VLQRFRQHAELIRVPPSSFQQNDSISFLQLVSPFFFWGTVLRTYLGHQSPRFPRSTRAPGFDAPCAAAPDVSRRFLLRILARGRIMAGRSAASFVVSVELRRIVPSQASCNLYAVGDVGTLLSTQWTTSAKREGKKSSKESYLSQ